MDLLTALELLTLAIVDMVTTLSQRFEEPALLIIKNLIVIQNDSNGDFSRIKSRNERTWTFFDHLHEHTHFMRARQLTCFYLFCV